MYLPSHTHPLHSPERVVDLGRLLLGLAVVALGVLYLLDGAGTLDADEAVHDSVARAVRRRRRLHPARAAARAGPRHDPDRRRHDRTAVHDRRPARRRLELHLAEPADRLAGLVIVARWGGRTISAGTHTEDVVRSTAVFGGPKIVSTARSFRGGWLTAIFGGITLDLRGAQPAPEGASINATVAFGGIDILVPTGWRISLRTTPIFGGVEDKTDHSVTPPEDAPVLHVDAVCLFGGVDIKREK